MSSRELVVANPITVAPEAMPAFFGLFLRHARKKGIINIDQRLALHPAFNIIHTQILLSHFMPEVTVLCFRVYHHAVKIKKYGGCFCCVHKLSFT